MLREGISLGLIMSVPSWLAAAAGIVLTSTLAFAHPKHPEGDPSEPQGADPGTGSGSAMTEADMVSQATALAEAEADAETIVIEDEAPAESASSVHLDQATLSRRSRTQPSDILRNVPGLVVSQHAGGGKADQYFIRGFDADHGTDIAIFADGIPVNLTSHGHGQGYADTHWMIPETIGSVDVHKGPYAARYGDFYTAGALELKTIDKVDGATIWIAGGSPLAGPRAIRNFNRRLVGMASPKLRDNDDDKALIAVQIADSDGPFIHPQGFQQGNALLKWQGKVGRGWLKLETNWYAAKWHASGQLPDSEVKSGRLNRFDSLDPSEGGTTSRESAQLSYTVSDDHGSTWHAMAYGVGNQLRLYSDFTLFARDPSSGDQIEQTDGRFMYGLDAGYERAIHKGQWAALVTAGAQIRADDVETGLWHDAERTRLARCFDLGTNPCNNTNSHIRDFGVYAEANIIPRPWLHLFPGIRIDQLTWDVEDLNPATRDVPGASTGGTAQRTVVSPKLSVEVHETEQVNLFANFGGGFHSNDARAAVATLGAGAVARAWGGEIGARVKPSKHARVSMDAWYLRLSSEQAWNGDEGGTSPSDPTRRFGLDIEGSTDATDWLSLDANVTWSHATFVANHGNAGAVALAPRWMGSGGVTVHGKSSFIALRGRGIADRPGNDAGTLTAEGYFIFDLIAGHRIGKLDLNLTLNNLLDSDWREAQFADSSRVTPTADVVEQMHFTPGLPLTATFTAAYAF
ncbi:MAG: putative TonB-dependent receptor [Myxococcales bacterium]|nr:putative TonB-dependent receptor [Myxococcales bacterium]